MTTTATGRLAEQHAVDQLERGGYTILDRNWRNRWCELDIVARRDRHVHFIEVKYRSNTSYGDATDYISHDKISRLIRAASAWRQAHGHRGSYQIDVMTVEGAITAPTIRHLSNVIGR